MGLPREIVLASASPRRRELLLQIGVESTVVPPGIDEQAIRHDDPLTLARELAEAKAVKVCAHLAAAGPHLPVLAADTIVTVDHHILEKPVDEEDARRMIEILSGKTHRVVTGVAIVSWDAARRAYGDAIVKGCVTHITLSSFSRDEITSYLASDEWRGVAGAYRIQGIAARYVQHLEGSYSNVVGLPLHLVYSILTGRFS